MYTFFRRTTPYPAFTIFDAPTAGNASPQGRETNTPLQALTTRNDPQFVEAARVFAQRVLVEAPQELDGSIVWAFRAALSRKRGLRNGPSCVARKRNTWSDSG